MSIKTITFYHRVNGVLTDAAAVSLSDIDAIYGVRRRDTLADLPGFEVGTTIPHVALGTYQIVLTGLTEGAPYEFRVRATYQGVDRYGGGAFVAPATGTEYITELDLDLELGSDNAELHADLNNEADAFHITTMRLDAITQGILRTDLEINAQLSAEQVTYIGTVPLLTGIRALAARKYAAGELMNKRSKQTRNDTTGVLPGDAKLAEADALIAKLFTIVTRDLPSDEVTEGELTFVPIVRDVCDVTTDENYRPVLWY